MFIPVEQIKKNLLNSNIMTEDVREKLKENIKEQGGKYPPLILREIVGKPSDFDLKNTEGDVSGFRLIDGHNRFSVLVELGYKEVECVIWEIDDKTEMTLLATLNELKGTQDLTKRAILLKNIVDLTGNRKELLNFIPEDARRFDFILSIVEGQDLSKISDDINNGNKDIRAERDALVEKYISEGMEPVKAQAMADIHSYQNYVPKLKDEEGGQREGQRPMLVIWFDSKEDYEKGCAFFETDGTKEPKTKNLMDLINEGNE